MNRICLAGAVGVLVMTNALAGIAAAQTATFDKTFLSDYSKLQPKTNATGGTELLYVAPGAQEELSKYNGVMVDEPEVLISPLSDYKGAKPDDLKAMAEAMRSGASSRLKSGGYNVVDAPGPGILYILDPAARASRENAVAK